MKAVHLLSWHVAGVSMWRCLGPCKGHIICVQTPVHVGLVADRPERTWVRMERGFEFGTFNKNVSRSHLLVAY